MADASVVNTSDPVPSGGGSNVGFFPPPTGSFPNLSKPDQQKASNQSIDVAKLVGQFILGLGYDIEKGILTGLVYFVFAAIFLMLIWVIVSDQNPVEIVQSQVKSVKDVAPLLATG